jgi:hypothetical protein
VGLTCVMRSRYNTTSRTFLILGLACAILVAVTASQARVARSETFSRGDAPVASFARHYYQGGRLIVQRAANFGTELFLNLSIDGREVANIGRSRRFDGFVPAGRRILAVLAVPNENYQPPTLMWLTVQPGHTYIFTASWQSDHVVLHRSGFVDDTTPARALRLSSQ